jgi:adenosylhomocysteine nucleosidase
MVPGERVLRLGSSVRTLLLVAAEKREFSGILRHCRRAGRVPWPLDFSAIGELDGRRVVLVANGPGPALAADAARTACGKENVEAVVSTGYCGALDPLLAFREIFVASSIEAPGSGQRYTAAVPNTGRVFRSGPLLSHDRVAQTAAEKARLRSSGAAAVDMEAAGVAREASGRGLPFFCVRVVLDRAGEDFAFDLNGLRSPDGRFSRARIVRAALARPRVLLPELIRIERNCRSASWALGEFFADCRFQT